VSLRFRLRGLLVFGGAVLLIGLLFEPTVAAIVAQRSNSADLDRLKIWQSALVVWTKGPAIGIGPGNFASYMETYSQFPLALVLQGYQQAHNIFLEVLAEEGVVGLGLLAVFVGLLVRSLLRFRPLSPTENFVRTAALGILAAGASISALGGGFIPTIASAGYNTLPYVLFVWFVIGSAVGLVPQHVVNSRRAPMQVEARGLAVT
jgi:O-antigen ligase